MLRANIRQFVRFNSSKAGHYDAVVIGGGPGGYVHAIKMAQLNYKTACIESRGSLGGTCLNVGCIPSKALLNNSHLYHQIKHDSANRGIEIAGDVSVNVTKLQEAKDKAVKGLTLGIEMLFKKYGVTYLKGHGSFVDDHTLAVKPIDGSEEYKVTADNITIATGSEATPFPGIEVDEERIVTSTGALALKEVPKKLAIIGGGIIGLEMASVWSRLGSEVTVIEFQNAIGAGMDGEVAKSTQKLLAKQGLKFMLGTKVTKGVREGDVVKIGVENVKSGKTEELDADVLLVAIGRRPYTKGLNHEAIGLEQDEGIAAAEFIKEGHGHVNYGNIPSVMYTHPEVAWVGSTEEQLKEKGILYKVGKFPFIANSRAKTNLDTDGFVKFLADAETHRVLGCHIIGPNAGEMIAEAGLALEYGASTEDIASVCHAHPTLAEAFKEAALGTFGKTINF